MTRAERFHPDCVAPTVKYDKKIMVCVFDANGTGYLHRVDGNMDRFQYWEFLE